LDENILGMDMSNQEYYRGPLEKNEFQWSQTFLDPQDGQPTLTLTILLKNGMLVGDLNLSVLSDIIDRVKLGANGYAVITDSDGTAIAHRDRDLVSQRLNVKNLELIKAGMPRNDGSYRYHYRGVEKIGSIAIVPQTRWMVVVTQPVKEVFAPLKRLQIIIWVVISIAILLAVIVALRNLRKVLKPLLQISKDSERFAKGDYTFHPAPYSYTEIDSLQSCFKSMAEDVKTREDSLRQALDEITELKGQLEQENIYLRDELEVNHRYDEIVGESDVVKRMLYQAEQVGKEDTTVLILGETGTGKELLARAIHKISHRRNRVLVKVNCAALAPTLIESELFGREKGAYTGALNRQIGWFEAANGSTLFLDEIGDLPLDLQAKLLRVLQESQIERLGSTKTISVDVRILAATNKDLSKEVLKGRFRKDLFYRLNVFTITAPSLQERREDIPVLVWAFVNEFSNSMGKTITKISNKCMRRLQRYSWPGNIRELRNVIEKAMIMNSGQTLNIDRFLPQDSENYRPMKLKELEREHILKVLDKAGWKVSGKEGAAEILGLKPTTLEARMKKLGIKRPA